MSDLWNREDISYCRCPELSYSHSHCPCDKCNGKAVSRATEYRHWIDAAVALNRNDYLGNNESDGNNSGTEGSGSNNGDGDSAHDNDDGPDSGGDSGDGVDGSDVGDGGSGENVGDDGDGGSGGDGGDGSDIGDGGGGENVGDGGDGGDDGDGGIGGDGDDHESGNGIRNDVIKAVTKHLYSNDDVSGSQQNFLNILEYGNYIAKGIQCLGNNDRQHGNNLYVY